MPARVQDRSPADAHWRDAGDRIQNLLDASSAAGALARERAEDLVREVVGLYGSALTRIVELLDERTMARLARDDLIASLLLVHGLHPHDVHTRIETALESVRPYLGSHGGDVRLVDVAGEVVTLELAGSCRSCPSSAVTLELAVEDAVRAAAPEIESIEVVAAPPSPGAVISADSLFTHVRPDGTATVRLDGHAHGQWSPVPGLADLQPGEIGGFAVVGAPVLACRVGDEVFAYRDRCAACEQSMAGTALQRRLGYPVGDAVVRCPQCGAHFDVVHAGAQVDGDGHLDPLPVLARDGVLSLAMPAGVLG